MRIIFVLDIFDSQVVHALRGQRDQYLPVAGYSSVCDTSDALEIVKKLHPKEVYVADLNRIRRIGDNFQVIKDLSGYSRTILSCGVMFAQDVSLGLEIANSVTIGCENADFDVINRSCELFDVNKIHVNIDIMDNRILTNTQISLTPLETVMKLNEYPINDLIIIDLTKVGTESGINVGFLEAAVACSDHNVIFGGGVRNMDDIELLDDIGITGALVATGIHNQSIPMEVLL